MPTEKAPSWLFASSGPTPCVRGLFDQQVAGDDALLRLAALRFEQAGMPAELYANTPDDAERLLRYVPPHETRPIVHLNRALNLIEPGGQAAVLTFVDRLGDRIAGLVVHDQANMLDRVSDLLDSLRVVGDRGAGPYVFLEYAFGAPLDWFLNVARRAAGIGRVGVCVDTGHIGLAEVNRTLQSVLRASACPTADDPALSLVVMPVQQATAQALPVVLSLIDELGALGSIAHFHLHDGHPAISGLSDHFSFLTRVPVPFAIAGARSLPPMYGPTGLAAILGRTVSAIEPRKLSLTLEVHQAEGRMPLDPEAAKFFAHWHDMTNAERLNYWLSVVAANHTLATATLSDSRISCTSAGD